MADFGGILATLRKEEKQLAAVPYGAKKRPRVANRRPVLACGPYK